MKILKKIIVLCINFFFEFGIIFVKKMVEMLKKKN